MLQIINQLNRMFLEGYSQQAITLFRLWFCEVSRKRVASKTGLEYVKVLDRYRSLLPCDYIQPNNINAFLSAVQLSRFPLTDKECELFYLLGKQNKILT